MKRLIKRVAFSLLILCILGFGVAASLVLLDRFRDKDDTNVKLTDSGLFSTQECMQGCWRGLKPNQSSTIQLLDFIHTELMVKIDTLDEFHFPNHYSVYSVPLHDGGSRLYAVTQDQMLRRISLMGNFDLTADEIITQLGLPSYVSLGYRDDQFNGLFTTVDLYYPHDGFVFNIRPSIERVSDDKVRICMEQGDLTHAFDVFEAGSSIQTITELESSPDLLPIDANIIDQRVSYLEPWPGFICVIRPYRS